MEESTPKNIEEYIAQFPAPVQEILQSVRREIGEVAGQAEEAIRYQMPTFRLNGKNLVHFAGYQHHVGFYPTPSGIEAFKQELSGYKSAKGSVQFPIDEPMPLALIGSIVRFRVEEVMAQTKGKRSRKMTDQETMVLDAMKAAGKPVKTAEVAEATGLDAKEAAKIINGLKKQGKVDSPIRCFYAPVK